MENNTVVSQTGDKIKKEEEYYMRPCPFCGGIPRLEKASKTIVKGEPAKGTYVRCIFCGARGRRYLLSEDNAENGRIRRQAVDAWNKRGV